MLINILLVCILLLLIIKASQRPKNFPPGPVGLPLLGYVPLISRLDRKYLYRAMRKLSDIYGPVAGFYAGPIQPMISVCSYEAVKEVLHNDDLNGRPESAVIQARTFFERLGIIFTIEDFWTEQRRFALRHLRDLGFGKTSIENQMLDEIRELIKELDDHAKSTPNNVVNMRGAFNASVLNILWVIIAGERLQRGDPKFKELLDLIERFFQEGNPIKAGVPVPAFLLKKFPFLKRWFGVSSDLVERIQLYIKDTIEQHRVLRNVDSPRDFIDVYLNEMDLQSARNPLTSFTEKQLIAIVLDLFGAGAQSTSNSIGFALIHLIRNPEIRRKVQEELDQVCGDALPTLADRSQSNFS